MLDESKVTKIKNALASGDAGSASALILGLAEELVPGIERDVREGPAIRSRQVKALIEVIAAVLATAHRETADFAVIAAELAEVRGDALENVASAVESLSRRVDALERGRR